MVLSKSKIFLICCLVFIGGIGLASFLPAGYIAAHKLWWFIGAVGCAVLTILFWQYYAGAPRKSAVPLHFFLFLSVLFLAVWRYGVALPKNTPDKIWHYNLPAGQAGLQAKAGEAGGDTVIIIGQINKEPDIRQTNQKLEIKTAEICIGHEGKIGSESEIRQSRFPNSCRKISGKLLITTNLYPSYDYGDALEIECAPEAPEKFNDFAYDRYLARYDIYSVCYYPKIKLLEAGQGNRFYENIFSFKNKLYGLIDAGLPEPESGLAGPIIFGGQKGLSENLRQQFSRLGLTHIMAVSGFNISILAAITISALLAIGVSRKQSFYLTIIILFIYIILVGLPASAMRAGLMGGLVLWALYLGRLNKLTNSLVLTGAILLLMNPKLLRDDIGFQLSFLAILGLIYAYPVIESVLEKIKVPEFKGLRGVFSLTLSAQVFTWPVIAYNFSQVSLIAPLSNLLVIWVIPFLTIAILIALGLSLILPSFSFLFFLPCLIILKYIMLAVENLSKIPFGYVETNSLLFNWWGWLVIYYIFAAIIIIKAKKRLEKQV